MIVAGENEEELVRIKIRRGGYRSSVSMDLFLANALKGVLGGDTEFKTWVQTTTDELDRAWQESASKGVVGSRVRAKSGLSRLIQREALRRILENVGPAQLEPPPASVYDLHHERENGNHETQARHP